MHRGAPRHPMQQLQDLFRIGVTRDLSDAQLLERFLEGPDGVADAAFSALVERHGPMVLGVCRRVLNDTHAAEDAFQATFLILVRKAQSVANRERLAGWLHGVALRTAQVARSRGGKHRVGELRLVDPETLPQDDPQARAEVGESIAALDEELRRLPQRYREALLLCALEGRPRVEAARQLGISEGTLSSRLSRGRDLLRHRLIRRGLAPATATTIATGLGSPATATAVAGGLATATVKAAMGFAAGSLHAGVIAAPVLALTHGVLKVMLLSKLKVFGLIASGSLAFIAVGSGVSAQQDGGAPTPSASASAPAEPDRMRMLEQKLDRVLEMLQRDEVVAESIYSAGRRAVAGEFPGEPSLPAQIRGQVATTVAIPAAVPSTPAITSNVSSRSVAPAPIAATVAGVPAVAPLAATVAGVPAVAPLPAPALTQGIEYHVSDSVSRLDRLESRVDALEEMLKKLTAPQPASAAPAAAATSLPAAVSFYALPVEPQPAVASEAARP